MQESVANTHIALALHKQGSQKVVNSPDARRATPLIVDNGEKGEQMTERQPQIKLWAVLPDYTVAASLCSKKISLAVQIPNRIY